MFSLSLRPATQIFVSVKEQGKKRALTACAPARKRGARKGEGIRRWGSDRGNPASLIKLQ